MSVSKFESLPNEILAELLEKYINGIDIINAFAYQLNRRFDALIRQSRRLRFNFIRCHKDDFRLCIGLLPAYFDKIEQLALAEQYTPGQIHAFLFSYQSFNVFKNLRKLYLHIDISAVEPTMLRDALYSISTTTLHTLSLDLSEGEVTFPLDNLILGLFRMKTLKKLLLSYNSNYINWNLLKTASSNIEYLTIHGIVCRSADLVYILQCAPSLKYLDISLNIITYYSNYGINSSSNQVIPRMSMFHTLILNLMDNDQTMLNELEPYFKCMPSLHHLEIRIKNGIENIDAWETLIKSALPSLTSFILEDTTIRLTDKNVSYVRELSKISFWTSKQHFHITIKEAPIEHSKYLYWDISNNPDRYRWDEAITQWLIGPERKSEDNSFILNSIYKLYLSIQSHFFSPNDYLNNVSHLIVKELNDHYLQSLKTHINCSKIKYLDVSRIKKNDNIIPLLLTFATNVRSLRIHPKRLYDKSFTDQRCYDNIQNLDISVDEHTFNETDMNLIVKTFPRVEHLTISTKYLEYVPCLQSYLPRLHSLTFLFTNNRLNDLYFDDSYEQQSIDSILRKQAQFHFKRQNNCLTVWIDQATLQDPYWQLNDRYQ